MIRKIRRDEYLKGYEAMSDVERREYLKRVGEWLAEEGRQLLEATERPMAKAQNIVLLSARWKEQEVAMFAEGARLLSALMDVADTWLPTQLYAKSAYRATRQIVGVLSEVSGDNPKVFVIEKNPDLLKIPVITEEQKQRIVEKYTKKAMAKMAAKEEPAEGTNMATQAVAASSIPAGKPQGTVETVISGGVPPRPKHIDQYIHLLPEKTQERAKQYGPLKREIEAARENMRLLMNDQNSSAADREKWAKLAARNDEKIAKINAELDREWEKVAATGRVVVDDLGMAHLLPDGEPTGTVATEENRKPGRPAMTEEEKKAASKREQNDARIDSAEHEQARGENRKAAAEKRAEEKAAEEETKEKADDDKRREYLKKWLRDTRTNQSDERRKQWQKNCKELLALGGEITESIRKAGEYYGVDLTKITTNTR